MFFDIFIPIVLVIVGVCLGSFFASFTYRYVNHIPYKGNERSFCDSCHHELNTLDLFPIFSYIFLRGKCRYCKAKIPPYTFLYEVLSGLYFLIFYLYFRYGYSAFTHELNYLFLFDIFILYFLIIGSIIDLKMKEVPYSILIIIPILTITKYTTMCVLTKDYLLFNLIGLATPLILFGSIYLFYYFILKKEAIGIADIVLFTFLGLIINFFNFVLLLLITSLTALLVILVLKFTKKGEGNEIPFVPYITVGYFFVMVIGSYLLNGILDDLGVVVYAGL